VPTKAGIAAARRATRKRWRAVTTTPTRAYRGAWRAQRARGAARAHARSATSDILPAGGTPYATCERDDARCAHSARTLAAATAARGGAVGATGVLDGGDAVHSPPLWRE